MSRAEPMGRTARRLASALALTTLMALGGCGDADRGPPLTILAGSELKDLEPLRADMEAAAGTPIEFTYTGSLDAVERLDAGERFDAVWLSHGKYLQQTPSLKPRIKAAERTMASPVILGVKRSKAEALGWIGHDPTWGEIAQAAADGRLSYAMTSPAASNTGFTALVGVASALAGTGDALELEAIRADRLADLFKGQKFIAGSSGWLADAYVERQAQLDGLINYESVILQLNAAGQLREPLVPVYPKEGIVTADYPLMLLDEARRETYTRLVGWLRTPEVQTRLSRETTRRPVVPGARIDPAIPERVLVELPFPASRSLLDALIDAYQARLRRPASTYFVVDTSGSMEGEGMTQLKASLAGLAGGDASLTGRFARFQAREQIHILPFSDTPGAPLVVRMPDDTGAGAEPLERIRQFAEAMQPGGGTAIFASVRAAYQGALEARRSAPERQYGIVVMSDGVNRNGMTEEAFRSWYASLPPEDQGIPVFALLFGEADPAQLETIARLTGGRVFDGRNNLRQAFKTIRGYL